MATKIKRCMICNKVRDDVTGLCPTPEECDKLRAPAKRLRGEIAEASRKLKAARIEHEHLGLTAVRDFAIPGQEKRHEDAVRRARAGWKRPRRYRERVA